MTWQKIDALATDCQLTLEMGFTRRVDMTVLPLKYSDWSIVPEWRFHSYITHRHLGPQTAKL